VLARNFVTLNVLAGPPEKWALKGSDFQLRLFSLLKAELFIVRLRKAERIIEVTVRPYVYSTLLYSRHFFTHCRDAIVCRYLQSLAQILHRLLSLSLSLSLSK